MRSSASSEVIACSMPASSGRLGLAPTAIRMRSAVWALAARLDRIGCRHPGARPDELDAGLLEHADVDAVQAVDLAIARRDQGAPVELRLDLPAIAARRLEVLGEHGAVVHQLLRHAAADHAGAADPVVLADRDPGPIARGPAGAGHAAGTAADHDQIEVRQDVRSGPSRYRCKAAWPGLARPCAEFNRLGRARRPPLSGPASARSAAGPGGAGPGRHRTDAPCRPDRLA